MDASSKNKATRPAQFQNSTNRRPPDALPSNSGRPQFHPMNSKNQPSGAFRPARELERSRISKDPKKISPHLDQNNEDNGPQQIRGNEPRTPLEFKRRKWHPLQRQLEEEGQHEEEQKQQNPQLQKRAPETSTQQDYLNFADISGNHLTLSSGLGDDMQNTGKDLRKQQENILKPKNEVMINGGQPSQRPSEIVNKHYEQSHRKSIENLLGLFQNNTQNPQLTGQQNVQSSNDTEHIQQQIDTMIVFDKPAADIGNGRGAGVTASPGGSPRPTKLDHQLQSHLEGRECTDERQQKYLNNLSFSSAKRKSTAMYRTTGEQVGHLMFRKSGYIREHENQRKGPSTGNDGQKQESEQQAGIPAESIGEFDRLDIESYENGEAKEYFVNKEQALEREEQIKEVIKSLQGGKIPSQSSSILERRSMSNSAEDAERNEMRDKPPADPKENMPREQPRQVASQESENLQVRQFNLMETISGRAIDYGLDMRTSLNEINSSLAMIYKNAARGQPQEDEYGESCLSNLSAQEIQRMYSTQNARWNFIELLQDELTFERDYAYRKFIANKIVAYQKARNIRQCSEMTEKQRQEAFASVGYLNRFLIYLIDKILHANFSSFQILIRNIELQQQKPRLRTKGQYDQEQNRQNHKDHQMHKQLKLDIWPVAVVYLRQRTKCLSTLSTQGSSLLARLEAINDQLNVLRDQQKRIPNEQFERWVMEQAGADRHDDCSLLPQIQQQFRLKQEMRQKKERDVQEKVEKEQDQRIQIHRQLFQNLNQGLHSENSITKQLLSLKNAQFLTFHPQNAQTVPPLLLALDPDKIPPSITKKIEQLVSTESQRQSSKMETLIKQTKRALKIQQSYRDLTKLHTVQRQPVLTAAIGLLKQQREEIQQRDTESTIGGFDEDKQQADVQIFQTNMQHIRRYTESRNKMERVLERYAQDASIQRIGHHAPNTVSQRLRDIIRGKRISEKKRMELVNLPQQHMCTI